LILGLTFAALLLLPAFVLLSPPVGIPIYTEVDRQEEPPAYRENFGSPANGAASANLPPSDWHMPGLHTFWMAGGALVIGLLGIDLWKLNRLSRRGIPVPELSSRFLDVLSESGRSVELLVHEAVSAPITWGVLRPAILLPKDALSWDEGELRRALIHEMEHVRRADWATVVAARVVCAVYWFHPLVWVVWRRLLLEAECACDDAVVRRDEFTEYAEQLVRLAQRITHGASETALGMASRSDLGTRVRAILDDRRNRGRTSLLSLAIAGTIVMLTVGVLAPLRAVAQRSLKDQPVDYSRIDQDLFEAAKGGRLAATKTLLDAGANPNVLLPGDGSPLIAAALRGHIESVRVLVERGADVDMMVRGDGSPLIAAATRGHVHVVEFLLDKGAKVDLEVPDDENALIGASAGGHLAVVELLVKRGANVNTRIWAEGAGSRPGEWRSPLMMAKRRKHSSVMAYLQNAGARD